MNIIQANNLDFPELLSKLGHEPVKVLKGGRDLWYISPLRAEVNASFHIRPGNTHAWVWKDFGDRGGSLFDFAVEYFRCSKKEALQKLRDLHISPASGATISMYASEGFPPKNKKFTAGQQARKEDDLALEFIKASPLTSSTVLKYLQSRKISPQIAAKYFYLVQYKNKNKTSERPFYGFGMKNVKDGYELRSASDDPGKIFKSAFKRDISFVPGTEQGRGEVNIFEGQMDFVSLLEMLKVDCLKGDSIIMHSLSGFQRTMEYIKERSYKRVNAFLDNNPAGRKSTRLFQDELGAILNDWSSSFLPHNDLNDALKVGHIPRFKPDPSDLSPNI